MTMRDGGQAFPTPFVMVHDDDQGKDYPQYADSGMTLRDWFAGQAIGSMVRASFERVKMGLPPVANAAQGIAENCYELADAMLTEREKVPGA